jgi:hypothetical protein
MIISDRFAFVSAVYNDYASKKTSYESLRTLYNDAATKESDRLKDFFKAMFEPPVSVPTRPCAPTQPAEYTGVTIDFKKNVSDGWKAKAADQGTLGALRIATGDYAANSADNVKYFHVRVGYMYSGGDAIASENLSSNIAHLWGRFGEGKATDYANAAPFYLGEAASTAKPGLMLTIFPEDKDVTELAASEAITFKAMTKAWANNDDYKVASRPGKADDPTDVLLGAKALLATGLAAATVIATIA